MVADERTLLVWRTSYPFNWMEFARRVLGEAPTLLRLPRAGALIHVLDLNLSLTVTRRRRCSGSREPEPSSTCLTFTLSLTVTLTSTLRECPRAIRRGLVGASS